MEWALAISHGHNIHYLSDPWQKTAVLDLNQLRKVMEAVAGKINFTRLYFGQEFCEKALLRPKELLLAIDKAVEHGMEFTLVTPYVTERGLRELKLLFQELVQILPNCEVVVNDWGILHLLKGEFPTLSPILGRLLNKAWRDPRINSYLPIHNQEDFFKPFQSSNLTSPLVKDLLESLKIERVELDNLPQGLDARISEMGYLTSLYLPYGCITSGRICLLGSWGLETREKFKAPQSSCGQKCRFCWLEMKDTSNRVPASSEWRILQKGNTVFYLQLDSFLNNSLEQVKSLGIDRIVLQPEPL